MLRNEFCFVKVFMFVLVSNFCVIPGQSSLNSGLRNGDECTFNETTKGVCTKIKNCDYITENQEYSKRIPDEIKKSLCLSKGSIQLVCCPSLFKPQILELNTRLESQFEKATCVNIEPKYAITQNIVYSQFAALDEFPFQATIGYKTQSTKTNNEYSYLCGGSLIADDIVITSATCLRNRYKPVVVKIGATSLNNDPDDDSESEEIEIDKSLPHPEFSRSGDNNIGLIKLIRPYNKTSLTIQPICISTNDENLPFNFTITGYNISYGRDENKSNWLLKESCNIDPDHQTKNTEISVKGYEGAESCFGDIGGPLIYDIHFSRGTMTYLYGIKSHGGTCSSSKPSIYVKVNSYIEWIKNTIEYFEKNNDILFFIN